MRSLFLLLLLGWLSFLCGSFGFSWLLFVSGLSWGVLSRGLWLSLSFSLLTLLGSRGDLGSFLVCLQQSNFLSGFLASESSSDLGGSASEFFLGGVWKRFFGL